jgi:K+-sensing histidine kinase KdpD
VFDPFLAAAEKSQEFGLNLMGLYLLVCHHGGRIHTKTSSGEGLNFVIDIPATPVYNVPSTTASREFVTGVLMNDALWERLLPSP